MTFIFSHFQASRNIRYSSTIIENYQFNVIEQGNTCLNTCLLRPCRGEKIRGNRQCPAISEYLGILRDKLQLNSKKIKIKT
jgi:hypothetical protein